MPVQGIEQSFLCYTVGPYQLPILYIVVYICQSWQFIPPFFPLATLFVSISVRHFCSVSKFIYILFFFGSTYKWYHMKFVFVRLTSLSMTISRFIHVAENGIILFFFMATMPALRSTSWVFYRLSLKLSWPCVVLMSRLELWGFWKHTTKVRFPSHHIVSGDEWYSHAITGEANHDHLVKKGICQVSPL